MEPLFVFSVVLLAAVLVSELAERSILSTAVLFLVAGFLAGDGVLGFLHFQPASPIVGSLADLALFTVLFTDGMRVGWGDLRAAWRLPGRALLFGLPLTLAFTAALAHWVAGLAWADSLLFAAVISPTDPVFASAIVGREEIPGRLRQLLNVESGLNDGLALPLVVGALAMLGTREVGFPRLLGELALGVALGVVIPWAAIRVEQSRVFAVSSRYEPLFAFAVGLCLFASTSLIHANEYLAAFAAGVTMATRRPDLRDEFHQFGELLGELLKLGALLVFGALISPAFLADIPWSGYLLALLVLVAVRPAGLLPSLAGTSLGWGERLTAAWFGPKGFASVVYGLLLLGAGLSNGDRIFHLVALVIAGSILAHSSTDVLVARRFARRRS